MALRHEVRTHTFANGLTLLVETMPDVQSAAFSLMVPAGSIYDPPGANGAASTLSDWIMRGAGDLDSRQLTTALDNLGLQRSEGPGSSHLSFSGATLAENLPAALQLYAEIIQRPHLLEAEFAPAQAGIEQSLKALEDEPRQKIMIELRKRCYDAPWGLPTEGTLSEVQSLTPEIVRRHFEQNVRPRDAILAIAGSYQPPTFANCSRRTSVTRCSCSASIAAAASWAAQTFSMGTPTTATGGAPTGAGEADMNRGTSYAHKRRIKSRRCRGVA